jgi:hypothetical protein
MHDSTEKLENMQHKGKVPQGAYADYWNQEREAK